MSTHNLTPMLLGLLALLASSHGRTALVDSPAPLEVKQLDAAHSHEFDILIFTQSWRNTVCIQWKDKQEAHKCTVVNDWSIHGLWPTKLGPGPLGPFFCNNTWHFNFADLAPIRKELDTKWTNIENGTAEDSLWKHEWQKHGTCAAQLEPLNSELKYFSKGIEVFDLHDMSGILAQSGIVPTSSKTYNVKEISDAVKSVIDKNVGVECWKDPKTQITYIFEIRICYNKNLALVDCDGIKESSGGFSNLITNCHEDAQIVYPDKVPEYAIEKPLIATEKSWLLRFYKFIKFLQWFTY